MHTSSLFRPLAALALTLPLLACGHHPGQAGASAPGQVEAPQPAPDDRSPGQVIVDILAQQGYACAAAETAWNCSAPNDPSKWQFTVSYVMQEDATTIWIDSYSLRAFGQRCARYTNAMKDLESQPDAFSVSCDDGTQTFRMNTAYAYGADTDVMAWMNNHLATRAKAWTLLDQIHAVRK